MIHVDVCPDCGTATTFHGLDAPGHCPHGFERRVPVEYIPRLTHEALREAIREIGAAWAFGEDAEIATAIGAAWNLAGFRDEDG